MSKCHLPELAHVAASPLVGDMKKGAPEGEVSKQYMRLGAACPHPPSVPKGFLHVLIVLEMPEAGYKQV